MTAALADVTAVSGEVVICSRCPRLAVHRVAVASPPPPRHAEAVYWSKPVPGMGDPAARLLVVGLAPGAHGANRTGLPFHGDGAGDWLFDALHAAGFSTSASPAPGVRLRETWLTNAVKCVPPGNRPSAGERRACASFLRREGARLPVEVVVALGALAWDAALGALGDGSLRPKPRFGHLAEADVGGIALLGSYHPSRQNVNTGRLTQPMLSAVFHRAAQLLDERASAALR